MNYSEWQERVPEVIREDALWSVKAYRLSLFLADIAWNDVVKLSEARGWFYRARHILGEEVTHHRLALTTEIIKLLLTMVPDQRQSNAVCEDSLEYNVRGVLDMEVPFNYELTVTDYDHE
jgi:hypothetical protein